jgi:hypothetical protein
MLLDGQALGFTLMRVHLLFFDVDLAARLVEVTAVERRTTTTYRKR